MARVICGCCGQRHNSVAAVKQCYRFRPRLMQNARRAPMAPVPPAPPSMDQATIDPAHYVWPYRVPLAMVKNIKEGRYAIELYENGRTIWTFVRVLRPTKGKRAGHMFVTTQHSETYSPWMTFFPGNFDEPYHYKQSDVLGKVLFNICTDPFTGMLKYGQELGHCCKCGKELTDNRSRWYGIGPECEKHYPQIINIVDETKGEYVP